jgi:O-antigen/teichoic acid export membrane protein
MSQPLLGPFDLGGLEPLVVVGAVVSALLWLALASFVYALRSPPAPPVGLRTLDLGLEPPAVANMLVNDFRVTDEAVPAIRTEVVADAKARGLSRDALDSNVFIALIAAAAIPAACLWAVWGFATGVAIVAGAVLLLGWIRSQHPQRGTPDGMEAASRCSVRRWS